MCSEAFVLRLTFPGAKLRRQIFMTRAQVWAKNWAKFSAHFRASFAVQNDPQIFSQNSSQFITPCLVAENLKFHLRELLGFGGRNFVSSLELHFCRTKLTRQMFLRYEFSHEELIECFRELHRGGRKFTSCLRFSGPFFHAAKRAFSPLRLSEVAKKSVSARPQARSWKERSGAGWDQDGPGWPPPRDLDGSQTL